jgi:hypothetical protein
MAGLLDIGTVARKIAEKVGISTRLEASHKAYGEYATHEFCISCGRQRLVMTCPACNQPAALYCCKVCCEKCRPPCMRPERCQNIRCETPTAIKNTPCCEAKTRSLCCRTKETCSCCQTYSLSMYKYRLWKQSGGTQGACLEDNGADQFESDCIHGFTCWKRENNTFRIEAKGSTKEWPIVLDMPKAAFSSIGRSRLIHHSITFAFDGQKTLHGALQEMVTSGRSFLEFKIPKEDIAAAVGVGSRLGVITVLDCAIRGIHLSHVPFDVVLVSDGKEIRPNNASGVTYLCGSTNPGHECVSHSRFDNGLLRSELMRCFPHRCVMDTIRCLHGTSVSDLLGQGVLSIDGHIDVDMTADTDGSNRARSVLAFLIASGIPSMEKANKDPKSFLKLSSDGKRFFSMPKEGLQKFLSGIVEIDREPVDLHKLAIRMYPMCHPKIFTSLLPSSMPAAGAITVELSGEVCPLIE